MKKFSFTLQSWYDMQLGLEKQHKLELKKREAELTKRRHDLDMLNKEFDRTKHDYCGAVAKGVSATRIKDFGHFFDSNKVSMAMVQSDIVRLEREKEQCMQKLIHTRRELKLLDKLREKQYKEHMMDARKQHEKFVDDLVSYNVTVL